MSKKNDLMICLIFLRYEIDERSLMCLIRVHLSNFHFEFNPWNSREEVGKFIIFHFNIQSCWSAPLQSSLICSNHTVQLETTCMVYIGVLMRFKLWYPPKYIQQLLTTDMLSSAIILTYSSLLYNFFCRYESILSNYFYRCFHTQPINTNEHKRTKTTIKINDIHTSRCAFYIYHRNSFYTNNK